MKFVEHRGKLTVYEIILNRLGVDIVLIWYNVRRPNQYMKFILDGEYRNEQVWNISSILYERVMKEVDKFKPE